MAEDRKTQFEISIDGKNFKVDQEALSGGQIKALVGKDATWQLFLEEPGNSPDQLIGDTQSVKLRNGMHFYTVPPATMGT